MKTSISYLLQTRKNIIGLLDKNSDKLTVVPNNFNNSLLWNAAHCMVTLELLAYKLSGLEVNIPEEYIDLYRKGSKSSDSNNINVEELKSLLISRTEQLEKDYNNGVFKNYSPYETSYGVTLTSIEDVITFNNIHEGVHFGYMLAMLKAL